MDKIHFPYRSASHLALLHVIAESGSWEKHGLQVEYDYKIDSADAHKNVANGTVEFVGGNHISPYIERMRGDRWVYLGQTVSILNHRLVVRTDSGISQLSDLRGKTVATQGTHPRLNTWLFLRQHGLEGDVELLRFRGEIANWEAVSQGKADAVFVTPPADITARRAGLNVIDVGFLPMVWFTTVSSGLPFVEKHPDIVDRFLRGIIQGVAYFKTHPNESIKIIKDKYDVEGGLDQECAAHLHQEIAKILQAKPYASVQAVTNVFELAKHQDNAVEKVEPLSLWDFHFLRRIDDSGFIDNLYQL